jgi:acyl-CoA thioester hydrolase
MYTKEFEVRWNDIDANRHLANSAYINYMSHTRLSYMLENGFGQSKMVEYNIGPVVFYEHMYYFKEVFPGKPIKVSLQLKGLSENGMYFSFLHNFYDHNGKNIARCEMMGGWIDLTERKLRNLPEELLTNLGNLDKTDDFKVLTKEDTRKFNQVPKNI